VTCLDELISDLKVDEGWWERPYRDHLGQLTIGWGFLLDERRSVALPRAVGDFWLQCIVAKGLHQ